MKPTASNLRSNVPNLIKYINAMEAITSVAHSVPVNESANARLIYVLQRYLFIIDLMRKALHLSVDAEF
jgi:hypothetical protein